MVDNVSHVAEAAQEPMDMCDGCSESKLALQCVGLR